jgi:hypothetical protein
MKAEGAAQGNQEVTIGNLIWGAQPPSAAVRRALASNTNKAKQANQNQFTIPNANDEGVVGGTRGACAPIFHHAGRKIPEIITQRRD